MRNIVFFDLETTGTDITKDQIIQLSMIKTHRNLRLDSINNLDLYIKPTIPINAVAQEVHGITMEYLNDSKHFEEHADEIFSFIDGCDISGFNILNFDCPILYRQLSESNLKWNYHEVSFYDSYKIFTKNNKRDLAAAAKFYLNEDIENAHNALHDTLYSLRVFRSQMIMHSMTYEEANVTSCGNGILDFSGFFGYNEDGNIIFTKGKWKDQIASHHRDYLQWLISADFSKDTKEIALKILNM